MMGKLARQRVTSFKFEDGATADARDALGLSQQELADESKVSLAAVKRAEHGLSIQRKSALALTKYFMSQGLPLKGPQNITLTDTIDIALSRASPRRGRLCSALEFNPDSNDLSICHVKEISRYRIIDEKKSFFAFGAAPDELLAIQASAFVAKDASAREPEFP